MTPNPGSDAALALGCKCPVLDNGRGKGRGDGLFIYSGACPIHNLPALESFKANGITIVVDPAYPPGTATLRGEHGEITIKNIAASPPAPPDSSPKSCALCGKGPCVGACE